VTARLARFLATVGGLGDVLPAPGTTVGSLAGVLLFLLAMRVAPSQLLPVAAVSFALLSAVAVWACGAEAARRGEPDPGPVVLDEVAGQWLALLVLVAAGHIPALTEMLAAFLLFRAFDVLKPWPIRALERLPRGWGIVADDLAAGLAAGVIEAGALALLR
jgi:phosphatidylglycerophosphatase A